MVTANTVVIMNVSHSSKILVSIVISDFRDVKCVLELDFVFQIRTLSLHEEFLVCTSVTECQAIQLNITANVCIENGSGVKELSGSIEHVESAPDCDGRLPSPVHCQCRFCVYASENNDVNSASSSQARNGTTVDQVVGISCEVGCCMNSGHLLNSCSSLKHSTCSPLSLQAKLQQEFVCSDLRLSEATNECDELYAGPVKGSQAPCPVSVEFEGIIFTCAIVFIVCLLKFVI